MASIQRTRQGKWQARWRSPDGRQAKQSFGLKRDAERFLSTLAHDQATGAYVHPTDGRVRLADHAARASATWVHLRPSTVQRDHEYLRRYVLPRFGDRYLVDIDDMAVKEWVAGLSASGLAPATVAKASQVLGKIMRSAVEAKLIAASPCDNVKLPRIERQEIRIITPAEVFDLAEAIDQRYRAAVLLGAYGGLRAGELFGLRARRVDLLRRSVAVSEIVVEIAGRLHFGTPKTKAGNRVVPIPQLVSDALADHLRTLAAEPDDHVFPAPDGGPVRLGLWRQRFWQPAISAAGLSPLRIHDLRHTAVSLWLAAGASPVEVARWAGHSSTVTVLDRYGHVLPRAEERVTAALDAMARRDAVSAPSARKSAPLVRPLGARGGRQLG